MSYVTIICILLKKYVIRDIIGEDKYNNIDFESQKRYNLLRKGYNTWKGDVCR